MPSPKWSKVEDFFNEALELPPDARPAFLQKIATLHPGLEKEIETLLEAHDKASDFLETPGIEQIYSNKSNELENNLIGKTVGAYKVEQCIGEGGMGVVYQAKRVDGEFEKKAAIKFVKDQIGSDLLLKRFQNERQALASLSHPNIAKIIDAGTFQNKHPYFIMEYIDGIRIDKYCIKNNLGVNQTLKLFLKVCSAVQYAHRNLIIHRDLKPSNLLVTKTGEPILLDFGIAKLLDPKISSHAQTLTQSHQRIFTPDFASPEQIKGENISTAADIYSLGVNLFKILTGALPFKTEQKSTFEVEKIIVEGQPQKPSTALKEKLTLLEAEPHSQSHQKKSPKLLTGDLDNIILKAIRKEPTERFLSVEQFAADIQNYLNGRPVSASKSTLKYRTSKFLKRHKTGVIFTTVILASLVAGVVGIAWQAQIAEQERNKAVRRYDQVRQLSNTLIFDVHGAIEDLPGTTTARKLVMSNALEYLDKLSQEENDPLLLIELAQAYEKIGNVLGNPTNANLGDLSGATQSYLKAKRLIESVSWDQGVDTQILTSLASINRTLGDVYAQTGKMAEAIKCSETALSFHKRIVNDDSLNIKKQKQLAVSYIKYGDVLGNKHFRNIGKVDEALTNYMTSLAIWNSLSEKNPEDRKTTRYLGLIHERLGTIHEQKKKLKKANGHFILSLKIRKKIVERFPANYDAQRDVAIGFENIAAIHKLEGDIQAAITYQSEALKIHEDLIASDPENIQALSTTTIVLERLSGLNLSQGNYKAARTYTKRFLNIYKKLAERPGATANDFNLYAFYLATCTPKDIRKPQEALKYAKKAMDASQGKDPNILDTVATAYFVNGQIDKAIQIQTKAISLLDGPSSVKGEYQANLNKFLEAKKQKAGN